MLEKSTIRPLSQSALPAMLCPAPRIEISSLLLQRKCDGLGNIFSVRALHDQRGPAVDHGVPDLTRFLVIGMVRSQHPAFDRVFKFFPQLSRIELSS